MAARTRTRRQRRRARQQLAHGKAAARRHARPGGRTGSVQARRCPGKAARGPRPRVVEARPPSPTEAGTHDLGLVNRPYTITWESTGFDCAIE
jgi:hypothetical protein